MQFKGTTLTINPSKYDFVVDSGYDSFPKNLTVVAPEGWNVMILQNGRHACNGRDTFTLASRKSSGLKLPLFGDVKAQIIFARHELEDSLMINEKKITVAGKSYTLTASCSYKLVAKQVSPLLTFMDGLKLKPNANGVMLTKKDINYIFETVLPNFLKVGSAGYAVRARTPQEKAYHDYIQGIFKTKLAQPFGYEVTSLNIQYFKVV